MKNIILIIISLISSCKLYSQSNENFYIKENQIIWQNVVSTKLNKDQIVKSLKLIKYIKILSEEEFTLSGVVQNMPLEFQSLGFTIRNTPINIANSELFGNFVVEIKEGRYRVTISDLRLIAFRGYESSGLKVLNPGDITIFNKFYLKDGNFNYSFKDDANYICNRTLLNNFDLDKINNQTLDW